MIYVEYLVWYISADTGIRDSKNLIFILVSTGKMGPAIEEVMMLI